MQCLTTTARHFASKPNAVMPFTRSICCTPAVLHNLGATQAVWSRPALPSAKDAFSNTKRSTSGGSHRIHAMTNEEVFNGINFNGSKKGIDLQNLYAAFRPQFAESSMINGWNDRIKEIFGKLDTKGDGFIDKEEFVSGVDQLTVLEVQLLREAAVREELSMAKARDADTSPSVRTDIIQSITNRMLTTAEVTVSKIFPAGFGWQTASCYAGAAGFASDSLGFALSTGCGDLLGVVIGHTGFYAIKKAVYDQSIDLVAQAQTGMFLGSAAFLSGFAWQPVVNFAQAAGCGFDSSVVLTGSFTGLCFFSGLRLGRQGYSKIFRAIEAPKYSNLKADAMLSASIGGATGAFVGTDVSFGDANFLRPLVGIEESMTDLHGAALAGASTAMGFAAVQTVQNVVVPKGQNWAD